MKKFYLPPQLNGITPHKNNKPLAKNQAEFARPVTSDTTDYATESFTQPRTEQDSPQSSADAFELDVEQALKEYYEYIGKQNNR